ERVAHDRDGDRLGRRPRGEGQRERQTDGRIVRRGGGRAVGGRQLDRDRDGGGLAQGDGEDRVGRAAVALGPRDGADRQGRRRVGVEDGDHQRVGRADRAGRGRDESDVERLIPLRPRVVDDGDGDGPGGDARGEDDLAGGADVVKRGPGRAVAG